MEVKPGYKQTEVGVIPEEWDVESLERISDPKRTICYGIVQVGQFKNDGVNVLAIKNLNGDYATNLHRCSPEIERPYVRSRVCPGDVLVSVKGTVGRVGLVPNHYVGNISRDLARISLTDSDVPEFWHQLLQSEPAQRRLEATTVGTTRLELSIAPLKKIRMPRPPKPEQRAIAEALSDVDGLLGGLDRLIAKKRDLKQAAMQQLLTGQTRLPGFHGEWEVTKFEKVVRHHAGNSTLIKGRLPSSEAAGLFPAYSASGQDVWCDHFEHEGDAIVVSAVGSRCGKAFSASGRWCAIANTHVVWPNSAKIDGRFLAYFINDENFWQKSGTGQPFVLFAKTFARPLRLPELPEQTAIAEVLTEMDAELAALEQRREKTRALKQAMMQELLTGRTRLV